MLIYNATNILNFLHYVSILILIKNNHKRKWKHITIKFSIKDSQNSFIIIIGGKTTTDNKKYH